MGWLPRLVPGIPFDEPEESTTAVTMPAATTAPSPVQNHHLLYTGRDSPAAGEEAAPRSAPGAVSAVDWVPEVTGEGGAPNIGKVLALCSTGSATTEEAAADAPLP